MRLPARLTSLIAVTAALAISAPMSPASAVPVVVGDHATVTPTVLRTVVPDECRDVAEFKYAVDLQAIGNAIEAQGYRESGGDPVYTALRWKRTTTYTGPSNFYGTGSSDTAFPNAELKSTMDLCPDDFSGGQVVPGTYSVSSTITVFNSYSDVCSDAEGCQSYPKLYEKTFTSTVDILAEGPPPPTPACLEAQAQVKTFGAKVAQAKVAVKKAKRSHNKGKLRKAKNRLSNYKGKLVTARDAVETNC